MHDKPSGAEVTGCADRYPMVDQHGRRLLVGDTIRFQYCSGRYGQTAIGTATVTDAHYPYGQIGSAKFVLDRASRVLRGRYVHDDFEHGHVTWVDIINR